jgi:hypothetical protein
MGMDEFFKNINELIDKLNHMSPLAIAALALLVALSAIWVMGGK